MNPPRCIPVILRVRFAPNLRVRRGKISASGTEVHAATFLRQSLIVLDAALLQDPPELARIWHHELCHFDWWRLSNRERLRWEQVLQTEWAARARGELGWSSELRKRALQGKDVATRTRRWREYCCESFCDTGAWLAGGQPAAHPECTLAARWRAARVRYNSKRGTA